MEARVEPWSLLGLEPTKDKEKIADAYHEKLAVTNPEDKPEEFKNLRAAFERAMELADAPEQTDAPPPATPLEQWTERAKALYADLETRRDPALWQALLEDPVCFSLGGRLAARDALLRFLMDHYFLPRGIWLVLDGFFDLRGSKNELYEKFPKDFVDYGVMNAINYPEFIAFDLFTDTTAEGCDQYIPAANRFRRALREGTLQAAEEAFAALKAVPATHPYTLYAEALLLRRQEKTDEALEACSRFLNACPKDEDGLLLRAQLLQQKEDYAAAEADLRAVLAANPAYNQARYDLVCVLENQGRYAEAKEILYRLQREQPRNRLLQDRCDHINKAFLPQLALRHTEAPDDVENTVELVWCHMQQGDMQLAEAAARELPAEMVGSYEYENLMSKLMLNLQRNEEAGEHLAKWEQSILALPEDDPKTPERRTRLPEAVRLRAWCLWETGRKEEGEALIQQAEERWPKDAETYLAHMQMLSDGQKALDPETARRCEELLGRFIELKPGDGYGPFLRGVLRFRQRRNGPAWQDFDAAQRCYGRELNCMAFKARIMMEDDHVEDARKLLEELKEVPPEESILLEYCRARLMELDGKKEQAAEAYGKLLKAVEAGEGVLERPGDLYFRCALLRDGEDAETQELIDLLQRGVEAQPDDLRMMDFLAFEHTKNEDYAAAEQIYRRMMAQSPEHPGPVDSLAELYRVRLQNYPQAAELYRRELALRETPAAHSALGRCLQECGEFGAAEQEYLTAIRQDPGQPAAYANLGGLYMALGRLLDAARKLEAALSIEGASNGFYLSVRSQLARVRTRMGVEHYPAAQALWQRNINAGAVDDMTELADLLVHRCSCDQALALLDEWKARQKNANEIWYLRHRASYLLSDGKEKEAKKLLEHCAATSTAALDDLARLHFNAGRVHLALLLEKKCVKAAPGEERYLSSLALYHWFAGHKKQAAETARTALALLEERRPEFERAMYHTKRAGLLSLIGEYDAAHAALAEARRAPLCRQCIYGRCKDADWYEAILREIMGDYLGAAGCVRAGRDAAPEETDFAAAARRLAKKGVRV